MSMFSTETVRRVAPESGTGAASKQEVERVAEQFEDRYANASFATGGFSSDDLTSEGTQLQCQIAAERFCDIPNTDSFPRADRTQLMRECMQTAFEQVVQEYGNDGRYVDK